MRGGLLTLSIGLALTPMSALAETTKAFQVTADIVKGCVVATQGAGQWGSINLGTVSGVAQGTVAADLLSGGIAGIQIDCTPNMSATISADNGMRGASGIRALGLNGASVSTIPYQLFADGSATPWTTQSIPLSFGSTTRRVLPIRGVATLSGAMAAGAYTDTVRITLSW